MSDELAKAIATEDVDVTVDALMAAGLLEKLGSRGSDEIFSLTKAGHQLFHILDSIHDFEEPICTPRGQG